MAGDGHLDVLTCITVDQLQNERSTGNDAWSSGKEVPGYHRKEKAITTPCIQCVDYKQYNEMRNSTHRFPSVTSNESMSILISHHLSV